MSSNGIFLCLSGGFCVKASRADFTGCPRSVLCFVVKKRVVVSGNYFHQGQRLELTITEHGSGNLSAIYVLLDQALGIVIPCNLQCLFELISPLNYAQSDTRAFVFRFNHHWERQVFLDNTYRIVHVFFQNHVRRNRQALFFVQFLARDFVHGKSASQHPASVVRNSQQLQESLDCTVFTESPVKYYQGYVNIVSVGNKFRQVIPGIVLGDLVLFFVKSLKNLLAAFKRDFSFRGSPSTQKRNSQFFHNCPR